MKNIKVMAKHKFNQPGLPYVIMDEDGYLQMYSHKGDRIAANYFLRLQDDLSAPPTVVGKFKCNIVGSKAEMMEEIQRDGEKLVVSKGLYEEIKKTHGL